MVAIVGGAGLGLDRSSAKVFAAVGQQGGQLGDATFGRYGENVYVNAADGNLMIDRTDEVLIGVGPDDVISRSYNSESSNQGYQTHNSWQINDQRAIVGLAGGTGVNTNGSYVTRIDADGSDTTYNYDVASGTYICTQYGSAEYRLSYASGTWTWTDAKNNLTETYDGANGGRLTSTSDSSGNALSYVYDTSGRLSTITTADGEYVELSWIGTSQNLRQVITHRADGSTLTRVRYTYDSSNRLSTVTTDLSPDDNSVMDGNKVVTTYAYDGTSDRVSKITQTGGAELDITYDSSNRVHILSQKVSGSISRTTIFTYTSSTLTTITDNNGQNTDLTFDSNGQLLSVTYPAASTGVPRETYSYTYNTNGDLKSVTDPLLNVTKYTYDGNDNLTKITDDSLNTTTFTYDASNHVLTKTYTPGSDPGTATTIRYAYNANGLLRFIVDGDGEVTEYQYNSYGQKTAENGYTGSTYNISGLSSTTSIAESVLASWASGVDQSANLRTDYHYDFRGNLDWQKSYSACDSSGAGLTSQTYTQISYVYDQFGQLKTRQTSGMTNTEVFTYDGLGRMTSQLDLNTGTTTWAWADGSNTCTVTLANGHTSVSTYNVSGELTSSADSSPGGTTAYQYDTLGQLSIVTDPTGIKNYFLYDNLGRKTADIAADGSITEYRYDQGNNLIATISYHNKLSSTQIGYLTSGGAPANPDISTVRPTADSANDDWSWRIYDGDGRLTETIDSDGGATAFVYDNMSNLISTTSYYNKINVATAGTGSTSLQVNLPASNILPTANSKDDVTRNFYDDENRLIGTLDADGGFSQIIYDHAGQKIETIAYSTKVSSGDMGDHFPALLTDVGTTAADIHTRYYYDDRGLLIYSLDASLYATQYVYDAAGHLTNTVAYASPITSASTYPLSYIVSQTGGITNPNNRKSWSVYDTATGNLAYSIDASGGVTSFVYDNMGNVVCETRYAMTRTTASSPDQSTMNTWAGMNASSSLDRTTRMVYDGMNRLVFTVDAENYVTENRYDAAGRITLRVRYATTCSLTGTTLSQSAMDTWKGSTIPSTAVQTGYSYDADGRLSDTIDDLGGLAIDTKTTYDAIGRVTDIEVASGTSDSSKTHRVYDSAGRLLSETRAYGTGDAATTAYTYDGMGNVLTVQDPDGNTTTYVHDALGQTLTKTDALSNVTSYTYDAFGNVATTTDPLGGVVYSFYDDLNQLIYQADQKGYVTGTTYSIGGAVTSITRYATPISLPPTLPLSITTSPADATTTFTLDKLDRTTKVTDAEGYYEKYGLDAFGDRVTVWAKSSDGTIHDGGETLNTYDRRGLLTKEVLPTTAYDSTGAAETNSITGTTNIVNTYSYDARGNLLQKVEAAGLPEARTTTYTYDNLDRLTQTQGQSYTAVTYDPLHGVNNVTTGFVPTTINTYDKRGNLTKTVDPSGAQTFFYYDDLNRKIAEVNAVGTLSTWTYDDNGNVLSAQVYGDYLSLTSLTAGGTPPAPVNGSNYRATTYTYDAIGRLLTSTVAGLVTGAYSGSTYTTTLGSVTTTNTYDKSINALHQTDGNGNSTWTYYNQLGQTIAEVDQDNYLTTYTLDQNGNVTTEKRYANAVSIAITNTTSLTTVTASVTADATNDRVTNFTYDRNGNRLTEERTGVAYYTVGSTGALTSHSGSSLITYTYNGLGEVTSKKEATNDLTQYTYDVGGRQTEVLESSYTNVTVNGVTGTAVQERTDEKYDGLGNLTYADTYDNVSGTDHHVTKYTYTAGMLTKVIDASGFERDYQYDKAGRLILASYTRKLSDNVTTKTEADVTVTDALGRMMLQGTASNPSGSWVLNDMQGTDYNVYGEVADRTINGVVQQQYSYDGAGRMWRQDDEGVYTVYLYDKAGNQTLASTSDGNALTTGYSWSGFASESDAATYMTGTGASGTISGTATGMVMTMTQTDARGQAVATIAPNSQLAATTGGYTTATITTGKTYNAFGEVLSETNGNGKTTNFTYNTLGKVTSQVSPQVASVDIHNTSTNVNPTQTNYYDISGRLVGVMDANGNLNTRALAANTGYDGSDALVAEEFHADGGTAANIYDEMGNVTTHWDQIDATHYARTDYTYDAMGRVLTQTNPTGTTTGGLTNLVLHYAYDGLGQRTSTWNNQLGSSVVSTTDYDAEGRVTKTVDMDGYATTYGYAWNNSQGTHGAIEDDGGWTTTKTNPSGLRYITAADAEGRTLKVDYDVSVPTYNSTMTYTYDSAGRLIQTYDNTVPGYANGDPDGDGDFAGSGETATYAYFNTGQLAQKVSTFNFVTVHGGGGDGHEGDTNTNLMNTDTLTTLYSYDKDGNEKTEETIHEVDSQNYVGGGTTITKTVTENETATYDALDRLTEMDDSTYTGGGGLVNGVDDPVTITLKYDANSNVRERKATYYLLHDDGSVDTTTGVQTEDDWYTYDAMNRFLITEGSESTGTVAAGSRGTTLTYDFMGKRTSAVSASESDTYSYSLDGLLTGAAITAGGTSYTATYTNDLMGRVTDYKEVQGSTRVYERTAVYDHDSLVTSDSVFAKQTGTGATTVTTATTYDYMDDWNNDGIYGDTVGPIADTFAGGSVTHETTHTTLGTGTPPPDTDAIFYYAQTASGGMVEVRETYNPDVSHSAVNYSNLNYDARWNLIDADIKDGDSRDVVYQTNADGEITERDTVDGSGGVIYDKPNITGPHARYYYFAGVEMGDVSNDGTSNVNYAAAIADHRKIEGTGLFQFGAHSGNHVANFDQSYDTINGLTYSSAPSVYTVQSGDTLQSIAQQIWGDSNFWYLIADANGLDSTATLTAGQSLIIPNSVANNQNNSSTYHVYDPNDAIGNVSPTTPPKPQGSDNCGVFGQILMAVIAIAVAAAIPGVGFGVADFVEGGLEGAIGSTAATIVGGAVGAAAIGAVSDVAAQGVGLMVGAIKSFSFKEVGMAALSGFIGGPAPGMDLGTTIATAAAANAITQGIEVATGLQKSFDWGGVAAAGVSAGVIHAVDANLGPSGNGMIQNTTVLRTLSGTAAVIASAATRTLINGTDFGDNILKGLPTVIGQTIGGGMEDAVIGTQDVAGNTSAANGQIVAPAQQINYQIPNINADGTVTWTAAQDPLSLGVAAANKVDPIPEGDGPVGPVNYVNHVETITILAPPKAEPPSLAELYIDRLKDDVVGLYDNTVSTVEFAAHHPIAFAESVASHGYDVARSSMKWGENFVHTMWSPGGAQQLFGQASTDVTQAVNTVHTAYNNGTLPALVVTRAADLTIGALTVVTDTEELDIGLMGERGSVFQSGARQILNPNTLEGIDAAPAAYDAIRADNLDVSAIAVNTGMPEAKISQIKDHLFFNDHVLDDRIGRFDADPDIANAWSRLSNGDYVDTDIDLLNHEYFESRFESLYNTDYRTAHDAANASGRLWQPGD